MANQIIIDIGAVANDGTGDPLRTAFGYVNDNFSNVWATGVANANVAFDGNKILTVNTNGNLVLSPNGTGKVVANVDIVPNTANVRNLGALTNRWSTVYSQYLNVSNDVTIGGNLTVIGNVVEMGEIVTDALTIQLANSAGNAASANGAGITVGANDNIATILYNSTSNVWTTNVGITATGNVTAPYFIGNGSQLTGITSYANANAVAYGQAGWAGNIIPSGNAVYSLGNATNQWNDLYVSNATIYMNNVPVSLTAGNVLTINGEAVLSNDSNTDVTTTGNITANDVSADGWIYATIGVSTPQIQMNDGAGNSVNLLAGNGKLVYESTAGTDGGFVPSADNSETIGRSDQRWATVYANAFIGDGSQLTGITSFGNLAIDNNNIYNTQGQGVIISNFNFVTAEAETAYVQIPAGNSTSDLNVVQEQGNVRLVANAAVWTFDTAGNLSVPQNINFNGGGIQQVLNEDFYVRVSDDEDEGWSIYNVVDDGAGTALTRTRIDSDGFYVQTDIAGSNYQWNFNGYQGITNFPGNLQGTYGGDTSFYAYDNGSGGMVEMKTISYIGDQLLANVTVRHPNVTISTQNSAYTWTFDGTGNLTVPNSILGTNSGAPVVIDAGGATGGYSFVSIPSFTDGGEQLVIKNKYNSSLGIRLETESGNFTFNGTGLTFPDSTTQTTAYTGSTYGDSNVTSLLSSLGANTISSTANITTTGNISGGNIIGTLVAPNTTANTYVLYNDSGVVGGSGVFTFNENGNILTIGTTGGTLKVADISTPQAGVNLRFIPSSGTTLSYGNLNPQFANTYDLGGTGSRWNNIFANVANVAGNANSGNVYTTNITLSGTGTAVNAGQGNILTNQVTGTQFNFLNGLYTVNLNAGQATANYALRLPADAGSSNQVLTTDGTGNLSWSTPASTYGDSNVTTLLASLGSNTISTTGNITSGNLNATTGVANVANLYMNTGYVNTPASTGINIVPGSTSTGTRVWSKLVPNANVAFSLGSTTEYWANAYVGNVIATTGNFTGNVTAANFSGNISITGNVTGTSPNVSLVAGSYTCTFDNTGVLTLPTNGGDEGGELRLGAPTTNTSLVDNVKIDVYRNQLRFFDGSAKGAYIDLSQAGASVSTLLNNRVSGYVNAGTYITMDNIKATVTTSGSRSLALATVAGSFNSYISGVYTILGGSSAGTGASVAVNTGTGNTPVLSWNFTGAGDTATYIVNDLTNNICYRITMMIGGGYNSNMITIERLV